MSSKLIQLQQYKLKSNQAPGDDDYMLTLFNNDSKDWVITNKDDKANNSRDYTTEAPLSTNIANLLTHLSLYSRYIFEPAGEELVCDTWKVQGEGDFMNIQPNNANTSRILELKIDNDNDTKPKSTESIFISNN